MRDIITPVFILRFSIKPGDIAFDIMCGGKDVAAVSAQFEQAAGLTTYIFDVP
jgi:hypothetical protein